MLKIKGIITDDTIIDMSEMKPCDIGIIVSEDYKNHIVMRTANVNRIEVMDFNNQRMFKNNCKVKLLPKGTKLEFEIL